MKVPVGEHDETGWLGCLRTGDHIARLQVTNLPAVEDQTDGRMVRDLEGELLVGAEDAPGVREGGALSQVAREVNVEALPMEVPEHLELDVSAMVMGDNLRIADLDAHDGVTFLDDPETVLATLTMPTRVEEPEEEAVEGEEGELAEGEERPEGAAEGESPAAEGESGTSEG